MFLVSYYFFVFFVTHFSPHLWSRNPTFAHIAVIRKKDERQKLKGSTCKECDIVSVCLFTRHSTVQWWLGWLVNRPYSCSRVLVLKGMGLQPSITWLCANAHENISIETSVIGHFSCYAEGNVNPCIENGSVSLTFYATQNDIQTNAFQSRYFSPATKKCRQVTCLETLLLNW